MTLDRREFLLATATGLSGLGILGQAYAQNTLPYSTVLSEQGCGRATGYAEANKIVTQDGKTHVAWLDSYDEKFWVQIRTLDRETGVWSDIVTIDDAYDNHGGPALTMDSQGYLHIAYYPHHHPMRYRRSLRPNDASAWGEVIEIGKTTTYPTLVCGPDDTLYFTCRNSSREEPWWVDLYSKPADADSWGVPRRILQADTMGYSHFMEALTVDDDGVLHLGCRIYGGTPARGHTVGYMKSPDNGATWQTADGTPIALPATASTVDIIVQDREGKGTGYRAGTIALADGTPYILYSLYDELPMQTTLAHWADGDWQTRTLRGELPDGFLDWGITMPGGMTFSENGTLYIVLQLIKPQDTADTSVWGHPSSELVLFTSRDHGRSFASRVLTEQNANVPRWLPSLERPVGHHRVEARPGLIYTNGIRGDNNRQIISNEVIWLPL